MRAQGVSLADIGAGRAKKFNDSDGQIQPSYNEKERVETIEEA